jgi:flagellar biosynthesis chaperone FliJ
MTTDLRRFEYALEPVRRQGQWRLEALHALLGGAQREVDEQRERLGALREEHRERSRQIAGAEARPLDPGAYALAIGWLADLRRRICDAERLLAELEARRDEVAEECRAQQRKVDAVERHRDDCVAEFAQEEAARQATDADREWLSRRHWAEADPDAEPEVLP